MPRSLRPRPSRPSCRRSRRFFPGGVGFLAPSLFGVRFVGLGSLRRWPAGAPRRARSPGGLASFLSARSASLRWVRASGLASLPHVPSGPVRRRRLPLSPVGVGWPSLFGLRLRRRPRLLVSRLRPPLGGRLFVSGRPKAPACDCLREGKGGCEHRVGVSFRSCELASSV